MNAVRISIFFCLLLVVTELIGASTNSWIATWATSPQARTPNPRDPLLNIDNQTVRERVRISIGGSEIRLRFSNEFGLSPLLVGSAIVALPIDASSVKQESIQNVTLKDTNRLRLQLERQF